MSKNNIVEKIQQLKGLIDAVTQSNSNTSEIWNLIKEIQTDFKQVTLERTEQQELWQNLQERVTELKYKQADIRTQNEEFVQEMLQKLEVIDYQVSEFLLHENSSKEEIEEAKKPLLAMREVLKTPFYPSKESRQAVWEIYNSIYQRLKKREDKYYENIKNERNKRFKNAEYLTENILDLINACQPLATPKAIDKLTTAMENLAELGYDINTIKPILEIKNNTTSLKIKSESFRDMKRFVRSHHNELTRENKNAIYNSFGVLQSTLDTAWEDYKKSRSIKQDDWRSKQIDFIARLELRISDQKNYKLKLKQRSENQKDYLRRLYSRLNNQKEYVIKLKNDIVKQEVFIGKQEKHLESLEDKYYMALSDVFKEKVNQWMDEAEDKIESAEDSIVAKKEKIKEVEGSFEEMQNKIDDVKIGIESIPNQMKEVDKSILEIQATIKDVMSKLE